VLGADELEAGQADTEFRGVLFWVNLARKDKQAEPRAQVVQPEQIPLRQEGDATVRVLVGEGSPVRLGTPALVLDIELPTGGEVTTPVLPGFQGFAYVLEAEAAFGANRRQAKPPQLVLLGRGDEFRVTDPVEDGEQLERRLQVAEGALGLWGAKNRVVPANPHFRELRTEF
jgi:redox-sensitive bicupin YhaK (pirin superfamily)